MMNTSFSSVAPDATVHEAVRALAEAPGAVSVPVVCAGGVLAGEVTSGALLLRAFGVEGNSGADGLTALDVMGTGPLTIGPEAGVRELLPLFKAGGGRVVHVVDDSGRLLGLITPSVMVERLCLYMEKTA